MWESSAHCEWCYLGLLVTWKQVKQVMRNKLVSNTPPWSLHQFLPPGSYLIWDPAVVSLNGPWFRVCQPNKPFPSHIAFGHDVSSQQYWPWLSILGGIKASSLLPLSSLAYQFENWQTERLGKLSKDTQPAQSQSQSQATWLKSTLPISMLTFLVIVF